MSEELHIYREPPGNYAAHYDPEGLIGRGHTILLAVEDLLEQTDEEWRKALDERDKHARATRAILAWHDHLNAPLPRTPHERDVWTDWSVELWMEAKDLALATRTAT